MAFLLMLPSHLIRKIPGTTHVLDHVVENKKLLHEFQEADSGSKQTGELKEAENFLWVPALLIPDTPSWLSPTGHSLLGAQSVQR